MKKTIVWILVLFLLASTVLAVSKPLAGKINGQTGNVDLFVEVDFLGNKEICVVNPQIKTGSNGDFATNLGNLVFKDFPEVKCNSQWKIGDQIWYEINGHQSQVEEIKSGTGLQWLAELTITPSEPTPSGGGSGSSTFDKPQEITIPKVSISLTQSQTRTKSNLDLTLTLLNKVQTDLEIKIILSESFNDISVKTITDKIFLISSFNKKYSFDLSELSPSQYKVQAFVYHQNKLIAISKVQKFFVEPKASELIEMPLPTSKKINYLPYQIALLIFLLVLLTYSIYKFKKKSI